MYQLLKKSPIDTQILSYSRFLDVILDLLDHLDVDLKFSILLLSNPKISNKVSHMNYIESYENKTMVIYMYVIFLK